VVWQALLNQIVKKCLIDDFQLGGCKLYELQKMRKLDFPGRGSSAKLRNGDINPSLLKWSHDIQSIEEPLDLDAFKGMIIAHISMAAKSFKNCAHFDGYVPFLEH